MNIQDIFSLDELFERVQIQQIFPDGKTFVDCIAKYSLASIHQSYEEQKGKKSFDLSSFVHNHFHLPKEISSGYISDTSKSVSQHIELLWNKLTRQPDKEESSLIPLPHPYIVPGGRFREIYYWDSYFTLLGLQVSNRVELIQNMVDNFSSLIDQFGYIPNGNRTYFLGRSQPPFFSCMVNLLSEEKGKQILIDYLPQLETEYNFWMKGRETLNDSNLTAGRLALLPCGGVLNHYWDENDTPRPESFREDVELAQSSKNKKIMYRHLRAGAESGWDFSSRWFKNENDFSTIHTTEIVPVDLNCLLYNLERTIAFTYGLSDQNTSAEKFEKAAEQRKELINKYCWNSVQGFYKDYDYVEKKQKDALTLAGVFPLFFEIATPEQTIQISGMIEKNFLSTGGVLTTTKNTQQQWDAPNGWAPLQWITIQGLAKYGYNDLAKEIAKRWMKINEKVYYSTGKMMEKYNVVTTNMEAGGGEYPAQDGFGWTNGVYAALEKWIR